MGRPMTCCSWNHASTLPTALVKEYENGIQRKLHKESFTSGGETIHTILTTRKDDQDTPPQLKKPHVSYEYHDTSNSG